MSLGNKTALVTGAGQGIGRGIALELASAGADVIITHLATSDDSAKAETVRREILAMGRKAFAAAVDVTDETSIQEALAALFVKVDRIDIVVNNAGVMQRGIGLATTEEDFELCHEVNVKGIWRLARAVIPHFKQQGGGRIINISSGAGRQGSPDLPAYCASKAAVISVTQSLAAALGPFNINVNCVCPGIIWTPMCTQYAGLFAHGAEPKTPQELQSSWEQSIPLRRMQTVEDIGHAVVFLASSRANNITGQALNVDGGLLMN